MKTCLYCWLVEPLRQEFLNTDRSVPSFEVPIRFQRRSYNLALFVDSEGLPEYAMLTIPDLEEGDIPADHDPLIGAVREHLLSVLRATYRGDTNISGHPVYWFIEPGAPYSMGLDISRIRGKPTFDVERARRVLIGTANHREELRLLLNGLDPRIPLQYRYLSLYKILELYYKPLGSWRRRELDRALAPFENAFQDKGVAQHPASHLHTLRDKCAHVRTGERDRNAYGVSEFRDEESRQVFDVMDILAEICATLLNERSGGRIQIQLAGDQGNLGPMLK